MNVLLTMVGLHDPFSPGVDGQDHAGPILTLLNERQYSKVILFSNKFVQARCEKTKKEIEKRFGFDTEIREFIIDDPTDYVSLLREMRRHYQEISSDIGAKNEYYICVTSGTPHMHACWVLLAASGEIPAHILNVRNKKFVSKERPLIEDIDYTNKAFPKVTARATRMEIPVENKDINAIIEKHGIIGDHPDFKKALEYATTIGESSSPALLLGETGTGKELFAHYIHDLSERADKPFVPVNCAAIPENLVESILFGHTKGSFTGATSAKKGKFEIADGGTLFLDEIGELPLAVQAKLLRVLEDGVIEIVGAEKTKKVDVRLIAATNRDLKEMILNDEFRADLYYRINIGVINIPTLRERVTDIPKIAIHVLANLTYLRKQKSITPAALSFLQRQNWPGNIRDLRNVIERSVLLSRSEVIDVNDIALLDPIEQQNDEVKIPDIYEGFSMDSFIIEIKKELFKKAVEKSNGNKSKAAVLLGVSAQAVHQFYKTHFNE